ncbi:MAG TPA: type VI secretion protein [Brevundimonas sp.]|nr:type VI secretion protein [Brevundimonas sp.]
MTVQQAIQSRLLTRSATDPSEVAVRLPLKLKVERDPVRLKMMRRLASSRIFALGNRSGVLRAAQNRSGRAFRLDVRQRVIVKALVSRHMGKGAERGAALAAHVSYLGRAGAGLEGARPEFFDRDRDGVQAAAETKDWSDDRHHFRFIISPEHGDRIDDLPGYVREVMARVSADLGEPQLTWIAICHYDTDQPHAHVLVRGRRGDGRDLVIPRDYIAYGMRARAQEVAQERLGDLSRIDAERRVWRETAADRFTALDRRLLAAAEPGGLVDDGVGRNDAWNALTRGRLRHLEGLGLAIRAGRRYRLEPDIETKLRTLQARRDIIRTLNQRRLEVDREVRPMGPAPVRGRVVKTGFHDELGAAPYVIVRDRDGVEHYARLRAGPRLELGRTVVLAPAGSGLAQVLGARGAGLAR